MKHAILAIALFSVCSFAHAQNPSLNNTNEKFSPQPVSIDHIAICVVNLDSTVQFYKRYFLMDTLPVPFKVNNVRWYRMFDGTQLHIVQGIDKPLILPPFSHFCVRVKDFDQFLDILQADGVAVHNGLGEAGKITVRGDGIKQALIKDPSGYWIEVSNAR